MSEDKKLLKKIEKEKKFLVLELKGAAENLMQIENETDEKKYRS